jgi:hypothetical protein
MKNTFSKTIPVLFLLLSLALVSGACESTVVLSKSTSPSQTFTIGASTVYVLPEGEVNLDYNPVVIKGANITYKWVCSDGTIAGTGSKVIWKSPNQYGTYPIMVTLTNETGDTESATADITVTSPPQSQGCKRCGN